MRFRILLLLALLVGPVAHGGDRVAAPPDRVRVGMSETRLARLDAVMQQYADERRIAGVVAYVARAGQVVHLKAYGHADLEAGRRMREDTIFRIASQTKAVTSVAAMMLVEEGRLTLLDPVAKYVPEFGAPSVAVPPPATSPPGAPTTLVPARRPITIRDLLTHTSGLAYGLGVARAQWEAAGIQNWYFADRDEPVASVVARMGSLPLDAQPGDAFVYGYSTDVLGVVVERVSGLSLEEFFERRIFAPLAMGDTFFYLPPGRRERLATVYALENGRLVRGKDPKFGQGHYVDGPRVAHSGGAGLLSTARDYGRFLQMLLNGGELDGVRLLGPKTLELMTVNHVGALFGESRFTDGVTGFGLGFEVVDDLGRSGRPGTKGAYGWGGAYHTVYWVDPGEQLVAILLTQLRPSTGSDLHAKFRALVYQAIVGPPGG